MHTASSAGYDPACHRDMIPLGVVLVRHISMRRVSSGGYDPASEADEHVSKEQWIQQQVSSATSTTFQLQSLHVFRQRR